MQTADHQMDHNNINPFLLLITIIKHKHNQIDHNYKVVFIKTKMHN
jgi:hypothetical protein